MSKTRRRPTNHGKHAEPAEIRGRNEIGDDPPAPRRRRNLSAGGDTRPGAPAAGGLGGAAAGVGRAGAGLSGEPSGFGAPAAGLGDSVGDGQATVLVGHPPWTTAGDYLRATAVDDAPARFGTPSGPVDDYARRVWQTAFGLAVRRRFEPDSPLAEITRTVTAAVHAHESAGLPALDAEMLVRAELGEHVPVDELDPAVLIGVHLLVFASLVDELALRDGELDDLVTQAERLAAVVS